MLLADAIRMAQAAIEHYLPGKGWVVQLDRAKTRNGQCRYREKVISLSEHYIQNNSLELVKDTILHEIAHAMVGPGHHHNCVWQAACVQIGARPVRCKDVADIVTAVGRWSAACQCGRIFQKHRKPKFSYYLCPVCKSKLFFKEN